MTHHTIDIHSIPEDKKPLYVNEPWIVDQTMPVLYKEWDEDEAKKPDSEKDNIRIYVPIDINKEAILRRFHMLINHYEEANYKNEMDFSMHVGMLVKQIEIYDQVWSVRHMTDGKHSNEAVVLANEFVRKLEEILDGGADFFPFDIIEEMRKEYLSEE